MDKLSDEYKKLDTQWNNYMESANRWAAEQNVNIYKMGILFGSMLEQYSKDRRIEYGTYRED